MEATSFEEATRVLDPPKGMDNCESICVTDSQFEGHPTVVSCWKLTEEEYQEFLKTKRIWLVVAGTTMPPVILTALKPV